MRNTLNHLTRALAFVVLGLLIAGEGSLSYGQATQTKTYKIVDIQAQSMEIPGQGEQNFEITTTSNIEVSQTGDRMYSVTFKDIIVEGSPAGMGDVDALAGLVSEVTLAADGAIESITGIADNAGVAALGGEDVYKDRIQGLFFQGPGEELAIGTQWTDSKTLPTNQGGLSIERVVNTSYSCVGEEMVNGVAAWVVTVDNDISMTGSGNQGGQDLDMDMAGETKGRILVEKSTGFLISSDQEGGIEGAIDLPEMSILMTISINNAVSSN